MTDAPRPRVSRATYLLGYAGLLPQVAAAAFAAAARDGPGHAGIGFLLAYVPAFGYAALILSFLGGIWWGFAMRRDRQGPLAAVAVAPSLVAAALLLAAVWTELAVWPLVALGVAIIATLAVDRHLVAIGEAPGGWMRLRAPLSLGLGGLTILTGLLLA